MCSSALRPHRALWEAFIRHLRTLEGRGTLTSDEAVAVVASQLTQTLLLDVEELHGPDEDADAQTLSEVVARIQAKNREEVETKISAAQAEATQRHEQVSKSADERVAVAQTLAGAAEEQHRQLLLHLQGRIGRVATYLSNGAFAVMFLLLVVGTAAGIARGFKPQNFYVKVVAWTTFGVVTAYGVYRATWGGSLDQLRLRMREGIRRMLTAWFTPPSTGGS